MFSTLRDVFFELVFLTFPHKEFAKKSKNILTRARCTREYLCQLLVTDFWSVNSDTGFVRDLFLTLSAPVDWNRGKTYHDGKNG